MTGLKIWECPKDKEHNRFLALEPMVVDRKGYVLDDLTPSEETMVDGAWALVNARCLECGGRARQKA